MRYLSGPRAFQPGPPFGPPIFLPRRSTAPIPRPPSRRRTGTATPSVAAGTTVTVTRGRSGYAIPALPTPGTGVRQYRWQMYDPLLNTVFTFQINPNAEGSNHLTRQTTQTNTTATDGLPLIFEGMQQIYSVTVSGSLRSKSQYDGLLAAWKKRYQLLLSDDLGRKSWIYIVGFDARRNWLHQHPYHMTYTMTYSTIVALQP